ncbi:hypothetical protein SAMN05421740_108225 [Parapedobacter koreensis]|uniref:Uncharacterized protein n=2 Tax=Parapedobacter koreensis TaxID=332977 RepID=A0A1H7SD61_9SPHI|nr:hypothetical protein SAMN05421740_108225 [Parapedobacter koreensis]
MLALAATFVGFSAFKYVHRTNNHQTEKWFMYDGEGPINEPSSYQLGDGNGETEPDCGPAGLIRCAVFVESDGGSPELPDEDALATVGSSNIKTRTAG